VLEKLERLRGKAPMNALGLIISGWDFIITAAMGSQKSFQAAGDCVRVQHDGILLSVKLQPRASVNQICGSTAGMMRIKVTAPPVDSAANEALLGLLSKELEIPRNRIELVRGHTSRQKVVKLYGVSAAWLAAKLPRPDEGKT
jgi:uncharacterized protein